MIAFTSQNPWKWYTGVRAYPESRTAPVATHTGCHTRARFAIPGCISVISRFHSQEVRWFMVRASAPEDTAKLVLWRWQHVELLSLKLSNNTIMRRGSAGYPVAVRDFSILLVWFWFETFRLRGHRTTEPSNISIFREGYKICFIWPVTTLRHYNLHRCRLGVGEGFISSKQAKVKCQATWLNAAAGWRFGFICRDKGGAWLVLIGSCGEQHLVNAGSRERVGRKVGINKWGRAALYLLPSHTGSGVTGYAAWIWIMFIWFLFFF